MIRRRHDECLALVVLESEHVRWLGAVRPLGYLPTVRLAERTMPLPSRITAFALCVSLASLASYAGTARAFSSADQVETVLVPYVRCELVDAVRRVRNPQTRVFFASSVATISLSIVYSDAGAPRTETISYTLRNLLAAKTQHSCERHAKLTSAAIIGNLRLRDWIEATAEVRFSEQHTKYDTVVYQTHFSLTSAGKSGPPWRIKMQIAALKDTTTTTVSPEIPVDLTITVGISPRPP